MGITPVVLCGGEGRRLWPLSRPGRPKPLLPLGSGPSLLADTLARFRAPRYRAPLLVAAEPYATWIASLHPDVAMLVEAAATGTAAAVVAAARHVPRDRVLLVVPADHFVGDPAPLHDAVERGVSSAEAGRIVLFGLTPTRAETGFGWIVPGPGIRPGVLGVARFEEKPEATRAAELLATGALWNAGMFLLRAGAVLELAGSLDLPPLGMLRGSFDREVVERASEVAVVPVALDWSDLGTPDAVRARNGTIVERGPGGSAARYALFPGDPVPTGALRILDGSIAEGRAGEHGAIVLVITSGAG